MISAKQLTPEQVETIKSWAADGAQMPEIQKRLGEELGLAATYMDTRFLVLDLGLELKEDEPEEEVAEEVVENPAAENAAGNIPAAENVAGEIPAAENIGGSSVSVVLDQVTKPGAMVSGRITFSDGETGLWWIDANGRPGLDTATAGYRPSEEDLMAFEMELRRLLEGGGA